MKKFIIRSLFSLLSMMILILCVANFEVSNNYIYQKFENTQYNKINWFLQKVESGEFKNAKYKGVFLGSSQCYYGVNDSILGKDYLNLGMNTPARDLDLYMKTKFLESGGEADCFYVGFDGIKKVSYGLHSMMPYLVTPDWLINHGQGILSLHFWKYLVLRAQVVLDDAITQSKLVKRFDRSFGVGYLDFKISKNRKIQKMDSTSPLIPSRYNNPQRAMFWDEFRNNIQSQWNFLQIMNKSKNNRYLVWPSFGNYSNAVEFKDFNPLQIEWLDSLIMGHKYWADPGHLNRAGGIEYSKILKEKL